MTPDDRDIRKPKTPPAGVSTQLARTPPTIEAVTNSVSTITPNFTA